MTIQQKKSGLFPYSAFRLKPVVAGMLAIFFITAAAMAADEIVFNTDLLDAKERTSIDLSVFSRDAYLMPGTYSFTPHINNSTLAELTIEFLAPENDPDGSMACLTPELVRKFGLKDAIMQTFSWSHQEQCLDLSVIPGITLRPDLGNSSLYITVPQDWLEYSGEDWEPPSRWDNGVAGAMFDYMVNALESHSTHSGKAQSVSGLGTAGINAGPWRLRADWQAQQERNAGNIDQRWDWNRFYLYRAITSLGAKLTLGENYLSSSMFDGFRFTGATLATDDNQLPPNLRGFAPEVSGIAKTNAKVTVSQQNQVIYETTVPAGPFRLQELNPGLTGSLDVKVEEQDGGVHTFQVNTENVPFLTRPGLVRYKMSAGMPSDARHQRQDTRFATGEFSWGINNNWSLYGGDLFAKDYNAVSVGMGRDLLSMGALSFDATHSWAALPNEKAKTGTSYRMSYAKRFTEYDSQLTFAGYRFSERDFMTMPQFLDMQTSPDSWQGGGKELYTIALNKQFSALNLSAYLNYSHRTYWNAAASNNWNISLSKYFDAGDIKNISMNVSAYRTQSNRSHDNGSWLNISLPFGNNRTLSYGSQLSNGEFSHSVGYYERLNDSDNYRLSASATMNNQTAGNGFFSHQGDLTDFSANTSFRGNDYRALGFSVQGGLTATRHGVALHRLSSTGGTRMMVDTDGIKGVPITGNGGLTRTNSFGKAVIGDVSSYYHSSVNVDLDKLPEDVDATRSVVQGTLTEGAIGYRTFGILAGEKSMVNIRLRDGTFPPFGAEIRNHNQAQTGIVGDDGRVWLAGIRPGESMNVIWNGMEHCQITLPAPLPPLDNNMLLLCQ